MIKSEVIKLIGADNWQLFLDWMYGQTAGINPDGSTNYYDWDVGRFVEIQERKKGQKRPN